MDQENTEKKQLSTQETLQEERYLWMARAFALVSLLALIANLLMIVALSGLTPLIRVQPFYIQVQDKDKQVISIEQVSPEELESIVLKESLVREYLLARFGIGSDVDEVERRWGVEGTVVGMSDESVYREFWEKESVEMLKMARIDGLTRDVNILYVNEESTDQGAGSRWVAEIELIDRSQRISSSFSSRWAIEMVIRFDPTGRKIPWSQRLKNPLGFRVTHFGRHKLENKNST